MRSWFMVCRALGVLTPFLFATSGNAFGQAHDHSHDGAGGHAHDAHSHSSESLAFRLKDWKVMHFDDANKAAQHLAAVQKLGCEVKQDAHSGHTDISYRSVEWKDLQVADHKLADQWQGWLKGAGFDVSHAHPDAAFSSGPEAVEFRLSEWKRVHGSSAAEDAKFTGTLQKLGCEVKVDKHDGHSDISFRAPTWRDIHLADHASAEQWRAWLEKNGFEAKHSH